MLPLIMWNVNSCSQGVYVMMYCRLETFKSYGIELSVLVPDFTMENMPWHRCPDRGVYRGVCLVLFVRITHNAFVCLGQPTPFRTKS